MKAMNKAISYISYRKALFRVLLRIANGPSKIVSLPGPWSAWNLQSSWRMEAVNITISKKPKPPN